MSHRCSLFFKLYKCFIYFSVRMIHFTVLKIINKEIKWGIKNIRQGIKIYPKDHADLK